MVVKVGSKSPAQESGTQVDGDARKPGDRQGGQDDKNCQDCYYQESQNDYPTHCIFMERSFDVQKYNRSKAKSLNHYYTISQRLTIS